MQMFRNMAPTGHRSSSQACNNYEMVVASPPPPPDGPGAATATAKTDAVLHTTADALLLQQNHQANGGSNGSSNREAANHPNVAGTAASAAARLPNSVDEGVGSSLKEDAVVVVRADADGGDDAGAAVAGATAAPWNPNLLMYEVPLVLVEARPKPEPAAGRQKKWTRFLCEFRSVFTSLIYLRHWRMSSIHAGKRDVAEEGAMSTTMTFCSAKAAGGSLKRRPCPHKNKASEETPLQSADIQAVHAAAAAAAI